MQQYAIKITDNHCVVSTVYCTAPRQSWAMLQVMNKYDGFTVGEVSATLAPHHIATELDCSDMLEQDAEYLLSKMKTRFEHATA